MVKNILIRVYMDFNQYTDVMTTAKNRGIHATSDSELLRKILFEYVDKIESVAYRLTYEGEELKETKDRLAEANSVIELLHNDIRERQKEIETLKTNLESMRNVRTKSRKKKGN